VKRGLSKVNYRVAYSRKIEIFAEEYKKALMEGRKAPPDDEPAMAGENFLGALADKWIAQHKSRQQYKDLLDRNLWARNKPMAPVDGRDPDAEHHKRFHCYPYGGTASEFWKKIHYSDPNALKSLLDGLSLKEFIALLMSTKSPTLYAESHVYGDGWDWNPMEMHILGDCNVVVPKVHAFDNGARDADDIVPHCPPLGVMYVYTSGILLSSSKKQLTADATEVLVDNKITPNEFYQKYEEKLLPALLAVNDELERADKEGFCNFPGLGCGQFAKGFSESIVKKHFKEAIRRLIKKHGKKLTRIKGICIDLYEDYEEDAQSVHSNYEQSGIELIFSPAQTTGRHHLTSPAKFNDKYKNCMLVAFVAADPVSMPNNEGLQNQRKVSDEAAKAMASDSSTQIYGLPGQYDKTQKAYAYKGNTFFSVIVDKNMLFLPPESAMQPYETSDVKEEKSGREQYDAFVATYAEKAKKNKTNIINQYIQSVSEKLDELKLPPESPVRQTVRSFYEKHTWLPTSENGYDNVNPAINKLKKELFSLYDRNNIKRRSPDAQTAFVQLIQLIHQQKDAAAALKMAAKLVAGLDSKDSHFLNDRANLESEYSPLSENTFVGLRLNVYAILRETRNVDINRQAITLCDETYAFAAQYQQALIDEKAQAGEDFQAALANRWIRTLSTEEQKKYQQMLNQHLWAHDAKLVSTLQERTVYQQQDKEQHFRDMQYPYGGRASEFWNAVHREKKNAFSDFLKTLITDEFISSLVSTKRPVIYAENAIYGDGWDWNPAEMHILGDCCHVVPDVKVFDNGFRRNLKKTDDYDDYKPHTKPITAIYAYVPAALLANGKDQLTADASDILTYSEDKGNKLDEKKFYELYKRRLLPVLRRTNRLLLDRGQKGFCRLPGLGAGAFLGLNNSALKPTIKNYLLKTAQRLIEEHHKELGQIKAFCLDFNSMEGDEAKPICTKNYAGSHIDLVVPYFSKTHRPPRLSTPESFGIDYKNLMPVIIVAADHVSMPNNEAKHSVQNDPYSIHRDLSDEAVCGCASDAEQKITKISGQYEPKLRSFTPSDSKKSFCQIMINQKRVFSIKPEDILVERISGEKKHEDVYAKFMSEYQTQLNPYKQKEIQKNIEKATQSLLTAGFIEEKNDSSLKQKMVAFYQKNTWGPSKGPYAAALDINIKKLGPCLCDMATVLKNHDTKSAPLLHDVARAMVENIYTSQENKAIIYENLPLYKLLKWFDDKPFFKNVHEFKHFLIELHNVMTSKENKENGDCLLTNAQKIQSLFSLYQNINRAEEVLNKKLPSTTKGNVEKRQLFKALQENMRLCLMNFILEGQLDIKKLTEDIDLLFQEAEKITGLGSLSSLHSSPLFSQWAKETTSSAHLSSRDTKQQDSQKTDLHALVQELSRHLQSIDNISFQFDSLLHPTILSFTLKQGVDFILTPGLPVPGAGAQKLLIIEQRMNGLSPQVSIKLTAEGCKAGLLSDLMGGLPLSEKQAISMKYLLKRNENHHKYKHWFSCCLFGSVSREDRLTAAWEAVQESKAAAPTETITINQIKEKYEHWSSVRKALKKGKH